MELNKAHQHKCGDLRCRWSKVGVAGWAKHVVAGAWGRVRWRLKRPSWLLTATASLSAAECDQLGREGDSRLYCAHSDRDYCHRCLSLHARASLRISSYAPKEAEFVFMRYLDPMSLLAIENAAAEMQRQTAPLEGWHQWAVCRGRQVLWMEWGWAAKAAEDKRGCQC
ncbi:hypothetical protein EDB86DRAFT_1923204 [Lactarius hatsudake]|nr:hypothetical protein EDB86DRAFT_1923204 [Lactarius hatsudake]